MQVNFLSQIRLSHNGDGPRVAKRLVDVYFSLFKVFFNPVFILISRLHFYILISGSVVCTE